MSEVKEIKLPRVLAAAKEFNVGQDTLIDFLVKKGFSKDDVKPTAKLTEKMYYALQAEFSSDKVAKNKADLIEIPKSAATERKKKDEEDISFGKSEKKVIVKEEPVIANVPIKKEEELPQPKVAKVEEEAKPVPEIENIKAPEIEAPKEIKKIDLSTIDSSTRPKKTSKKKAKQDEEKIQTESEKNISEEAVEKKNVTEINTDAVIDTQEEAAPLIENIKAEKIEGPKIVGKINLPVENDVRPKAPVREEKRKRKRIPVDRKGNENVNGPNTFQRAPSPFTRDNRPTYNPNRNGNAPPSQAPGNRFNRPAPGTSRPPLNRGPVRNNRDRKPEDKEIDQKQIQEKIRETQAKLSGSGGRGKSLKAKYRRAKREEAAETTGVSETDNKLQVTEFVTVSELANLMDVSFADVISKCMNLGIMVSINQRLDAEVIELVAGEFNFEVEFMGVEEVEEDDEDYEDNDDDLIPRAPIVTIMGHVDHGKTSLLDYIRSANVVAGEAGGITQHIGAYQVTTSNNKKITFLDTPGHEAFTAMRARGAKAADIAVIVIAADDAVMPQTKEAISHAQAASLPMIFAINKIDKDGANPQKIYEQLAQMNILVEEWGGKYQSQEISAKQGLNVDKLLEKILLEAELLELKANAEREATGTIIEASLDKGRGYVATILVQNGTLNLSDLIVSGQYYWPHQSDV